MKYARTQFEPLLCRNEPPRFAWQTKPPPCRPSLCYAVNEPPTDFLNKQRNEWREVEDILKNLYLFY